MDAMVRVEQAGRDILERFFQAAESGDMESMMSLVRDDIVMFWPQSGERFVGKENAARAMEATEVQPTVEGVPEVIGNGDVWTLHTRLRYGDDLYHYVGVSSWWPRRSPRAGSTSLRPSRPAPTEHRTPSGRDSTRLVVRGRVGERR